MEERVLKLIGRASLHTCCLKLVRIICFTMHKIWQVTKIATFNLSIFCCLMDWSYFEQSIVNFRGARMKMLTWAMDTIKNYKITRNTSFLLVFLIFLLSSCKDHQGSPIWHIYISINAVQNCTKNTNNLWVKQVNI